MGDHDYDYAQAYVDRALPVLGLTHWAVRVLREPLAPDGGYCDIAGIEHNLLRREAEIRLSEGFWMLPSDKQRHVIAHELYHLHGADEEDFVADLEKVIPSAAWKLFKAAYDRLVERRVEAMEDVLATMLPEWGT